MYEHNIELFDTCSLSHRLRFRLISIRLVDKQAKDRYRDQQQLNNNNNASISICICFMLLSLSLLLLLFLLLFLLSLLSIQFILLCCCGSCYCYCCLIMFLFCCLHLINSGANEIQFDKCRHASIRGFGFFNFCFYHNS